MSEAEAQIANDGAGIPSRSYVERILGALRMDASVFTEVADDAGAIGQAAGVVALAAVARVVGTIATDGTGQAFGGALTMFAVWLLGTVLVWGVGHIFRHPTSIDRVLRVVGFAMAPLILVAFAMIPSEHVRAGVSLIALALLFGSLVVGVRAVLHADTGIAALICLVVGMIFVLLYMTVAYLALGSAA